MQQHKTIYWKVVVEFVLILCCIVQRYSCAAQTSLTYYVSRNGTHSGDGLTPQHPFKTLQDVADALSHRNVEECTIFVEAGIYPEPTYLMDPPARMFWIGVVSLERLDEPFPNNNPEIAVVITGTFQVEKPVKLFSWTNINVKIYSNESAWELPSVVDRLVVTNSSFKGIYSNAISNNERLHMMTIGRIRQGAIFTNVMITSNTRGVILSSNNDASGGDFTLVNTTLSNVILNYHSATVRFNYSTLMHADIRTNYAHLIVDNTFMSGNTVLIGCNFTIHSIDFYRSSFMLIACGYNDVNEESETMNVVLKDSIIQQNASIQIMSTIDIRFNASHNKFLGDGDDEPVLVFTRLNPVSVIANAWHNYWGHSSGPWSCCNDEAEGRYIWELIDFSYWCLDEDCTSFSNVTVTDTMCVLKGVCDASAPVVLWTFFAINLILLGIGVAVYFYTLKRTATDEKFVFLFKCFMICMAISLTLSLVYTTTMMGYYIFYTRPELAHQYKILEPFLAVILLYQLMHAILAVCGIIVYKLKFSGIRHFFIYSLVVLVVGAIQIPVFLATASVFITILAEYRMTDSEEFVVYALSFPPEIAYCYIVSVPALISQILFTITSWKIFVRVENPELSLLNKQITETTSLLQQSRQLRISAKHVAKANGFIFHFVGVAILALLIFGLSLWLQLSVKRNLHLPGEQFELFFFVVEPIYTSASALVLNIFAAFVMRYRHYETALLWGYTVVGSFIMGMRSIGIIGAVVYFAGFFKSELDSETLAGLIINALVGVAIAIWQCVLLVSVFKFRKQLDRELPSVVAENMGAAHQRMLLETSDDDAPLSLPPSLTH